jgi:4-diphosphocytidyl-2-C-methyl-D-erythritol kinase
MRMPTCVRSHAKVNLGLYIGAPRPDGFHSLVTVYQTLEVHDRVTVTARPAPATALCLAADDERVPADSRNTAWKMISLVLKEMGVTAEVEIRIEKRLPIQGGLGAGSANAVAAFIGLETELGIGEQGSGIRDQGTGIRDQESGKRVQRSGADPAGKDWTGRRLEIAAQVGSDVPLFLVGGTVLGLDHGQHVTPLPDLAPTWCVLAIPETGVATPQAFRDWDALCAAEGLTPEASAVKLNELSRAYARAFGKCTGGDVQRAGSSGVLAEKNEQSREDLAGPHQSALVRTGITSWIQNDFERVVFPQYPSLAEIKRVLAADGAPEAALYASLSGSGSVLYGLYRTRGDAEAAQDRIRMQFGGVEVQLTRTLPRKEYWSQMILSSASSG